MTTALATRQQLLKPPPPPLSEETVQSWTIDEEQRAQVLKLVRFVHASHDQFLDLVLAWEQKLANAESQASRLQYEAVDVQTERREMKEAEVALQRFAETMQRLLGTGDLGGLSLKSQLDALHSATSNMWNELVQLRASARGARCMNCGMAHFTQDCDSPSRTAR